MSLHEFPNEDEIDDAFEMIQDLDESLPDDHRSGFVAVIGRPNVAWLRLSSPSKWRVGTAPWM